MTRKVDLWPLNSYAHLRTCTTTHINLHMEKEKGKEIKRVDRITRITSLREEKRKRESKLGQHYNSYMDCDVVGGPWEETGGLRRAAKSIVRNKGSEDKRSKLP